MARVMHSQPLLQVMRYTCVMVFTSSDIAKDVDVVE